MTMTERPRPVILCGPTGSGKTELACKLCDTHPFELVSVDSALVYRGLDIGTAKPDADTRATYPHKLIDLRDPAQAYSVAEFLGDATGAVSDIQKRGNSPLLVGGTMMYIQALVQGLSPLPAAQPALRARLEATAQQQGWPALHERLLEVDPVLARMIAPHDSQRIQRALEVYELTGQPLSVLQRQSRRAPLLPHARVLALLPQDRQRLHQQLAARFRRMLQAGLLDEVRALRQRPDLHAGLPAMRSVGYRQAWAYLDGEYDYDTFVARALAATRQLAKRQMTWLRNWHHPGIEFYDPFAATVAAQLQEALALRGK